MNPKDLRLPDIIDGIPDAIMVIDRDHNIVLVNTALSEMNGQAKEEILKHHCYEINHRLSSPCELPHGGCPHREVFKTAKSIRVTHVHYGKTGDEMVVEVQACPLKDEKGRVTHILEIIRDITKVVRTRDFLNSVLEGMGEGVVVIGRDYKIVMANRNYLEQVGEDREKSVVGRHCYRISHKIEKLCHEVGEDCPVKKTFETGGPATAVHVHRDREGKEVYVEISAYPLKDSSGNVVQAIEILRDITKRKKAEAEIQKHVKELEEFYDMAVGRELKMIELEKEVERLKEELKKYEKA